jgi:hypothetical protein
MTNLSVELIKQNRMYFVRDGYDWTRPQAMNSFPPTIFHGTSAALLPSILQYGLTFERQPVLNEDHQYIEELQSKYSQRINPIIRIINYQRYPKISASYSYFTAASHAAIGPESIERLIKCLDIWLKEELETQEIERLRRLKSKYMAMMKMHMPVVVCVRIDPNEVELNQNDAASLLTKPDLYARIVELAQKPVPIGELSSSFDIQMLNMIKDLYYLKSVYPKVTLSELMEIFIRKDHYAAYTPQVSLEKIAGIILAGSVAAQVA